MSAFLPIKAGGWAFGEVLTSAQMNQLNTDFPFALNMRDGGTYTPSGDIVINGITLSIGGGVSGTALNSSDTAFVSGVATIGFADIVGGADIVNGLTVDTVIASGFVNMTSAAQVQGGFSIAGGLTSSGGATLNGRSTFNDRIVANAGARFRTSNLGTISANVARSVDDGDIFYIPDSTVSSLNFTINNPTVTTAEDGIWLSLIVHTVNNIVVKDPGGATLITLTFQTGSPFAATFYRIAGSWFVAPGTSVKP